MPDQNSHSDKLRPSNLDSKDILIAEYNYIAQTAFQANEDRARVSNFFFVTAGAAIGAILSARFAPDALPGVYLGFAILFGILSAIGLFTLLQLARLRSAWEDSVRAMNVIKDYYIKHHSGLPLDAAFLWRMQTIPKGLNWKSVSFLLAFSVMIVCVGTTTAAGIYTGLALASLANTPITFQLQLNVTVPAVVIAFIFGLVEFVLYEWLIREAEHKQDLREKAHYEKYLAYLPTPHHIDEATMK